MVLSITNKTANPLSYAGGNVAVAANGTAVVSATLLYPTASDAQLSNDAANIIVTLSDGVNVYQGADAVAYLKFVLSTLGSQVVGLVDANAPIYAIQVGVKDVNGKIQVGQIDTTGGLKISGDVASTAADSGSPVKIGAVYSAALPSPSPGDRVDVQANQFGELSIQYRNKFYNQTGNTTNLVKSGAGRLHGILINKNGTGGMAVLYDNTADSGTIIATLDFGNPSGGLPAPMFLGPLGLEFSAGLTVVTSGSDNNNITILYQ